jgi:pilus assembly protein Flp/PilA
MAERETMTKFVTSVKNFLVSEDGPTAVEYAIMLALIVIVCIGAVQSIGTSANAKFGAANSALNM